ncbi:hypothetical protein CHUAL_012432 [Chamberlinius hualienensis]
MACCLCGITIALILAAICFIDKYLGIIRKYFRKIDKTSSQNGGSLVAEVIKAHGVKHVFTLCGGHISPILVGLEKLGVRIIDTRNEVNAVFAADATARLSGTVGVAIVTAGPGLTNTVTAVKNAQMAESPVVLIGGAAATILKGRGSLQDIDQMSLFKPLCKFCATVTCVRDIVPTVKKAFQAAQSGTPGPVFLEFPIDCLYSYKDIISEVGLKSNANNLMTKVMNLYLSNYVDNIFDKGWDNRNFNPLNVDIPLPDSTIVNSCAKLIAKSLKPVIVVGSQSTLPPTPVDKLRKALESIGIPCYLGGMSRGLLGRNSPIQMRQRRSDALKEADLIILAGSVCDFRLSYGRILNSKAKIIAINRNKDQLYKNARLTWKPTLAAQCDVATLIVKLATKLSESKYNCPVQWIQTLRNRDIKKEEENVKMSEEIPDDNLNPIKVLMELENVLSDDTILVADGGDFVGTAAYVLRPRFPLSWLDPGAFGTLGVGGGFALGAKLCRPECDIWIIYGDGSSGYSLIEFDTFERHKLPVIALIGNDSCWTQMARDQVPRFGSAVACNLKYSDYHKIGMALGGKGILLGAEDKDKLKDKFKEALQLSKDGHSVVINALIGRTKFREGSISV